MQYIGLVQQGKNWCYVRKPFFRKRKGDWYAVASIKEATVMTERAVEKFTADMMKQKVAFMVTPIHVEIDAT